MKEDKKAIQFIVPSIEERISYDFKMGIVCGICLGIATGLFMGMFL